VDSAHKEKFCWTAMLRLPKFVTREVSQWACRKVEMKKHLDTKMARHEIFDERVCGQCMHAGPFDDENKTVEKMEQFIKENGLKNDLSDIRHHHKIYLSDPGKIDMSKMKTVIRIPVSE